MSKASPLFRSKDVDIAIRTIFTQMNIIIDSFNATKRFILQEKFGYDGTFYDIHRF